ncbi:glycoside hydrolase family 97 protein [Phocaeicola oris]|uniref:glycoside hydrolase family 97 protein n=1 Tax=Phocaeicola oris TaxID=2896850 RepID=UPI00234F01F2|nr:glycoside hydrolase family 97 protein [Phocaeicola oris]MCE2617583.1 glycoside hydrolase family 97 protein [Phocaeicola oris]
MKKTLGIMLLSFMAATYSFAQKQFTLSSPDGNLKTTITADKQLMYNIICDGREILAPSPIGMKTDNGTSFTDNVKVKGNKKGKIDETINSPFYRSKTMENKCNTLTIKLNNNWDVEFRAYNNGIAYRIITENKKPFNVIEETVAYNFPEDYVETAAYADAGRSGDFTSQFGNSFEATYNVKPISQQDHGFLAFLPVVVDAGNGVKLCLSESHLESYPGLYLTASGNKSLKGVNAPYPKEVKQGGHNELEMLVQSTENYIAKVEGPRTFPWRVAMISRSDKEMADNNLTYLLGDPSRLKDISWIKPGKVAWDWWNDWNIEGVDFRAGINNDTYKYYIDFAEKHGIEYVILDEGWAVNKKADLFQVIPEIDLQEIINYGKAHHVGIILWAGYWAFARDMEHVCKHFAEMGVKGFKVDFMNRDDALMTQFLYDAAEMAAKYHLMMDYHGIFKPAGINRTYPNVINCEAVHGLEQMKWRTNETDQVTYDTQIPYIRQAGGPMDYTQGAMRNATRESYYPSNSEPMSQGTRCHQLGLYVVLDSPINMLCDTPTNYNKEPECTEFIAAIPTTWDMTKNLDGEIGKYIVTMRQKDNTFYIGGVNNWDARDIVVDTSVLPSGTYKVEIFQDGINADRKATDYKKVTTNIKAGEKMNIHLAPGGGFAIKFIKQ